MFTNNLTSQFQGVNTYFPSKNYSVNRQVRLLKLSQGERTIVGSNYDCITDLVKNFYNLFNDVRRCFKFRRKDHKNISVHSKDMGRLPPNYGVATQCSSPSCLVNNSTKPDLALAAPAIFSQLMTILYCFSCLHPMQCGIEIQLFGDYFSLRYVLLVVLTSASLTSSVHGSMVTSITPLIQPAPSSRFSVFRFNFRLMAIRVGILSNTLKEVCV